MVGELEMLELAAAPVVGELELAAAMAWKLWAGCSVANFCSIFLLKTIQFDEILCMVQRTTIDELQKRTGLRQRHVRRWLDENTMSV